MREKRESVLTGKNIHVISVYFFQNKREFNNYEKSQKSKKHSEDLLYKLSNLRESLRHCLHTNSCSKGNGHLISRDLSEKYCLSYVNNSC